MSHKPPAREDYEQELVGLFLLNPSQIDHALREGFQTDFVYHPMTNLIVQTVIKLHTNHRMVDFVSVRQEIEKNNEQVSSVSDSIAHLESVALPTAAHVPFYVRTLRDLYIRRELLKSLQESCQEALSEDSAEQVAASAMFRISRILDLQSEDKTHDDIVGGIMDDIQGERTITIPCRHHMMRRRVRGFTRGKVSIVAARPGHGKSTFAVNEASWLAKQGYRVGFISLEMSAEEILALMVCEEMQISWFELRERNLDAATVAFFHQRLRDYRNLPLIISDRSMTIQQIVAWIKSMVAHRDLDIVFLDYVQSITPSRNSTGVKRYEEVTLWSNELARVAKDTGVAIVELCQLRREAEPPPGIEQKDMMKYIPRLSQLKESGALEQDAYLGILLCPNWAQPSVDGNPDHMNYIVNIEKHRGGPTGMLPLQYFKDQHRFHSPGAPRESSPQQQLRFRPIDIRPPEPEPTEDCPF